MQFLGNRLNRKPFEADHQRNGEAVHPVAMLLDVLPFNVVQHMPDFVGSVLVVVEKGNEIGDCPLEVDIVFPERVIGVDEQVLARLGFHWGRAGHISHLIEPQLEIQKGGSCDQHAGKAI
jgi:hypothetical protein